jgi:PAS domain S-box-containing protein
MLSSSAPETTEELYENAPCGYLSTTLSGSILRVNKTFADLLGRSRESLRSETRLQDVLAPGGRIYYETHVAPLLSMQGEVREIAFEMVRRDGTRVPVLANAVVRDEREGGTGAVLWTVFDATERRRYEQELLRARSTERQAARALQHSLLSGELPRAENLEVARSYKPALRNQEIGGDWFDSFWLDDGETIALVVGDVVGKGIDAAAAMAQLRSAVRALATTPHRPAALLEALDRYSRRHQVGYAATLLYATLTLANRSFRYACAGHPPPLSCGRARAPRFLWEGRSVPLGVNWGNTVAGGRRDGTYELPPDSTIVLYTDGLIERRTEALDVGLDRLASIASRHAGPPTSTGAEAIVQAMDAGGHHDDVCLLMAHLAGG